MTRTNSQTFADVDLSEMMNAANKARSEELVKMFRQARAYFVSLFAAHGAAATQS